MALYVAADFTEMQFYVVLVTVKYQKNYKTFAGNSKKS